MQPADSDRRQQAEEDRALVRAVAAGDERALADIYDRYAPMLLGLATRIVKSPAEAEDVVQEALLQAWRQAERYDPKRSSVATWLVLITRSRAIDRLRSRKVRDRTAQAAHDERRTLHASPEGGQAVFTEERRRRLVDAMSELPPEQRQTLELAFFHGMTQREIAAEVDIPLGTVKTRSLLAMRKLRKALADEIETLL